MPKIPSVKLFITFLLCFIFIEATIYLKITSPYSKNTLQEKDNSNISVQRDYWRDKIKQIGAQNTYDLFKKENQQNNQTSQHTYAHLFGELLYNAEGIKGIGICDSTFAFGCYHSFFARAINKGGSAIVKDLNEECVKKFGPLGTGCQHGIGHGILEYAGHKKLADALEICTPIQKFTFLGCVSGVFMEYNFPTTIDDEKALVGLRPLDKNNPFDPCESMKKQYRKSCYYELAQWWKEVFASDFEKMGNLCQTISEDDNKESCFLGLGHTIAPTVNYDSNLSIATCKKMPDVNGQTLCLAGASWSFFVEPGHQSLASFICDASGTNKKECLTRADLTKEETSL